MERRELYSRLNRIFKQVFDDPTIHITPETTSDDIEDWDSLEHITLINAIERTFKMKFKMKEITCMRNVGEMAKIIAERTRL